MPNESLQLKGPDTASFALKRRATSLSKHPAHSIKRARAAAKGHLRPAMTYPERREYIAAVVDTVARFGPERCWSLLDGALDVDVTELLEAMAHRLHEGHQLRYTDMFAVPHDARAAPLL